MEIEGCLSSRSECCRGFIRRAKEIEVEYQDVTGSPQKKTLTGFEARVFQHEYDHIQGVLHIDRQKPDDKSRSQPFLDALIEQHGPGGALDLDAAIAASLQPPLGPPPKPEKKPVAQVVEKSTAGFGGASGFGAAASVKSGAKKKPKKKSR